jgi:CubicO group peptidase (beta-lactamase class C family)
MQSQLLTRFRSLPLHATLLCLSCALQPPIALSQPAAHPRKVNDAEVIKDLRSELHRLVLANRFSGAVLLAKGNRILFERAYGYADRAFDARNKVDTKFNLGSMGKMFTAVSILQLVEQRKLRLDMKLIDVLPDYPNRDVASKVTIYQLLTHTSGMGDFFGGQFMDTSKDKFRTLQSLLPLFVDKPLLFTPGTRWSYSNAGYIVLGLVIERVSGESYYDYVREHVFKPAGMKNTDNYDIDADVPNLALGYTKMGQPPGAPPRSNICLLARGNSAGGGYSTVEDLWRFSQALQAHKLLNKRYTDLLMTGKVASPEGKYAFGMIEQYVNGARIVGHGGTGPGIDSDLDIYPGLGYTVAVMSNVDAGARPIYERLRLELSGEGLPQAIHLPADVLRRYAGTYIASPPPGAPPGLHLPPLDVHSDADGLWLQGMAQRHDFRPLSPEQFFDIDDPNVRITFTTGANGQVTGGTFTGVAGPMPIKAAKQHSRARG